MKQKKKRFENRSVKSLQPAYHESGLLASGTVCCPVPDEPAQSSSDRDAASLCCNNYWLEGGAARKLGRNNQVMETF